MPASPETEKYETSMTPKMTSEHIRRMEAVCNMSHWFEEDDSQTLSEILLLVRSQSDKQGVWVTTEEIERLRAMSSGEGIAPPEDAKPERLLDGRWYPSTREVYIAVNEATTRWLSGASR